MTDREALAALELANAVAKDLRSQMLAYGADSPMAGELLGMVNGVVDMTEEDMKRSLVLKQQWAAARLGMRVEDAFPPVECICSVKCSRFFCSGYGRQHTHWDQPGGCPVHGRPGQEEGE